MSEQRLIRIRNITVALWLLLPVFIVTTPYVLEAIGVGTDNTMYFVLMYGILCCAFGYALQRVKCPKCNQYMFRDGKLKYALQKFMFRRCGYCGCKLGKNGQLAG